MRDLTADEQKWVDETFSRMTLREKIGQLLMPYVSPGNAAPLSIGQMCATYGVAGGHMFRGSAQSRRSLAKEVWESCAVPPLLSGDLESGAGDCTPEATQFPSQMAVGATDDETLAEQMGEAIAVEGQLLGFNWNFGPMVDICAHQDYLRQTGVFGSDPCRVGALAAAQIRGIQSRGMAACAKHFPGDGFDDRDQHLTCPVNPLSRDEWFAVSAVPFAAAIRAGVLSVMNTDISVPSIDPAKKADGFYRPSVVSPVLTREILREQLGFQGVIVTDALNMAGMTYWCRRPQLYLEALLAGNDLLLFVRKVGETVEFLEECVGSGRLSERLVDEKCRRVLAMKALMGLHRRRGLAETDSEAADRLACSPYRQAARAVAQRSVTLLRDSGGVIPLRLKKNSRIASVCVTHLDSFSLCVFDDTLRQQGFAVTSIKNPQTDEMCDRVVAGEFDLVILSIYYPSIWGWGTTRVHGPDSRVVMSGFPVAHPEVPAVYISFANPFLVYEFAFMDPYLVTYGGAPEAQRAAALALAGAIPVTGRVPCRLDGFFERNDGIQRGSG